MIIVCTKCRVGIRVVPESLEEMELLVGERSDYWPNKYPCYKCGKSAVGVHEPELSADAARALEIVNLSVQETYAALNGLGIPVEQTCCYEVLAPLFEEKGIKIHGRQPQGQLRFLIDRLEFSDGTNVYFAPSSQGAAIYRVVKPHNYTEQTLDGTDAHRPELSS